MHWSDAEFLGKNAGSGVSDETRERLETQRFGARVTHDDACGGAVAHRRTISRSDGAFRVERGFEFGENVEVRIGAGEFLGRERKRLSRWFEG